MVYFFLKFINLNIDLFIIMVKMIMRDMIEKYFYFIKFTFVQYFMILTLQILSI